MGAVVSGTLAFGADPGANEAESIVAAAGCTAASRAEAFVQSNSTGTNTIDDHQTLAALVKWHCTPGTDQVTVLAKVDGGFYASGDFDIEVVWQ